MATSRTPRANGSPGSAMYEADPSLRIATAVGPNRIPVRRNCARGGRAGPPGTPNPGAGPPSGPSAVGDSGGTGGSDDGLVTAAGAAADASGTNGSGRP